MRLIRPLLAAVFSVVLIGCASNKNAQPQGSIYDYTATTIEGESLDMAQYKGKVLLIVNTASKCGFTPQFDGLEKLHEKYGDRGLVVIGFPCNQFGNQDPGNNEEIASFCRLNYGVTFQMMEKIDVNGKDEHPVFQYLKRAAPSTLGSNIKWNFTKFLVSRDGATVKRFEPTTTPEKLTTEIERLLAQ